MKTSRSLVLLLLLSAVALPALADEPHQHEHGAPPEKLGTVHFAVSCSEAARPQFERAVALLHSFWYDAAQKAFLDVAKTDPSCAMAYWGVAMSNFHPIWAAGNPGGEPTPADLRKGTEAVVKAKETRGEDGARARLHRRRRGLLPGRRQARSPRALPRLRDRHGARLQEIPGRSRSRDLLRPGDPRHGFLGGQDLRRPEEGRRRS